MKRGRDVNQDALLDRATRAMKETTIPQGPSPQVVTRWLATIEDAASTPRTITSSPKRRAIPIRLIAKVALAVAVLIAVIIGLPYLIHDGNGAIAFADVLEQMRRAKTVTWTEVQNPPEAHPHAPPASGPVSSERRCAYKSPGHERQEIVQRWPGLERKQVVVFDHNVHRCLVLDLQEKTAYVAPVLTFMAVEEHTVVDALAGFTGAITAKAESLGERDIGNRKAVGFRIGGPIDIRLDDEEKPLPGPHTDFWVDAQSKRLVLAESTAPDGSTTVLKDFVFDQELDDSLFSLEPPEGYQLIRPGPPEAEQHSPGEVYTFGDSVMMSGEKL